MKTKMMKLTYEAPEASVDVIMMEQCILSGRNTLPSEMDYNKIYEDDFDD